MRCSWRQQGAGGRGRQSGGGSPAAIAAVGQHWLRCLVGLPTCYWARDQRGPCYVVVPAVAYDSPPLTCPPRSIVATGSYSEKDAAQLIRDIVRVVAHCHSMGVIHRWGRGRAGQHALHPCKLPRAAQRPAARAALPRAAVAIQESPLPAPQPLDHTPPACQQPLCTSCLPRHGRRDLKPENFLLESKDPTAPIKCTDFGLSVFFKPGQKFKEVVGSGGRGWGGWAGLGWGLCTTAQLAGRQARRFAAADGEPSWPWHPARHGPPSRLPHPLHLPGTPRFQPTTWRPRC